MSAWKQTRTGRPFVFAAPVVEAEHLFTEVATALAGIPRFANHTCLPYSIAQHSVVAAEVAEDEFHDGETAAFALLGDAWKAYFGEIPSPSLQALREEISSGVVASPSAAQLVREARAADFDRVVTTIRLRISAAIFAAAGLDASRQPMHAERLAKIAIRLQKTERIDLMMRSPEPWDARVEHAQRLRLRGGKLKPLNGEKALARYCAALQRLCPALAAASPRDWS